MIIDIWLTSILYMLYSSPIFGPIHSRRLGVSLGINLLPAGGKRCTFDCIYCECGLNAEHPAHHLPYPGREVVAQALEARLQQMNLEGPRPDVLTFAGNGEPTLHPQFAGIIDDTLALRDKYFPQARVSVLSNATLIHRPVVREALMRVDNNILKLDTVDQQYIRRLDVPVGHYDVDRIIDYLTLFDGQCVIQTIFLQGTHLGRDMDNTTPQYVQPWLRALQRISPRQVMIYTIDRPTPFSTLCKASHEALDRIARQVREAGINVSVSY